MEFGNAWAPFYTPPGSPVSATARTADMSGDAELAAGIAYMKEQAEKMEKPMPDIVLDGLTPPTSEWNPQALLDKIAGLKEMGLSWVSQHVPGDSRSEWCENMERYSEEVVAKIPR